MISDVANMDCMEYMAQFPDKFFDLAVVDPPYGIHMDGGTIGISRKAKNTQYTKKAWDTEAPDKAYFTELQRCSKNQIIFGANHFISRFPYDSSCWIVWNKENGNNPFADCELAWTSFDMAVRMFTYRWQGMLQGNMKDKGKVKDTPYAQLMSFVDVLAAEHMLQINVIAATKVKCHSVIGLEFTEAYNRQDDEEEEVIDLDINTDEE